MKHNRDPESKPKAAQGKLMWKPPEYPGSCFDLHFDRFDGLIFEAEKPFETCAPQGPPQYSCGSILFYICSIASHRTLLLSLSMNLQQLKKLCRMDWQHTVEELSCVLCVPCFEVLKMAPRSRQRFCQVGRSCSGAWKALEAMPSPAKVAGRV